MGGMAKSSMQQNPLLFVSYKKTNVITYIAYKKFT